MPLYNPVTLINKKDKLITQISNVVKEVSPTAYDIHTGDNSISNQVIYPTKNGLPPRMVTYVRAGTFSDLVLCIKDLLKIIHTSNDTQLQVETFIISYLAPNQKYGLTFFIKSTAKHFGINPAIVSSIVNSMVNQGILHVSDNNLILPKASKIIDITKRNDPSTLNFKHYVRRMVQKAKTINKDSFGNQARPKAVNDQAGHQNSKDLTKIKHLMTHITTRKINRKDLNHQISKDIVDSNQDINKTFRGKITKRYIRAVKVINYVLDSHLHKFTYKNISQGLNHKTASALYDLRYDGILKRIHSNYMLNSHYLYIDYRHPKIATLTTDRSGNKPKFFKYIIK